MPDWIGCSGRPPDRFSLSDQVGTGRSFTGLFTGFPNSPIHRSRTEPDSVFIPCDRADALFSTTRTWVEPIFNEKKSSL